MKEIVNLMMTCCLFMNDAVDARQDLTIPEQILLFGKRVGGARFGQSLRQLS
jgi:hypothetical protein